MAVWTDKLHIHGCELQNIVEMWPFVDGSINAFTSSENLVAPHCRSFEMKFDLDYEVAFIFRVSLRLSEMYVPKCYVSFSGPRPCLLVEVCSLYDAQLLSLALNSMSFGREYNINNTHSRTASGLTSKRFLLWFGNGAFYSCARIKNNCWKYVYCCIALIMTIFIVIWL